MEKSGLRTERWGDRLCTPQVVAVLPHLVIIAIAADASVADTGPPDVAIADLSDESSQPSDITHRPGDPCGVVDSPVARPTLVSWNS